MKTVKNPKTAKAAQPRRGLPITVSHPDKVFWPADGYTKLDLIEFYADIFPKLAPYVKDRILTMERCPDGMLGQCFYQKEAPENLPAGTRTKSIRHTGATGKSTNYVVGGSLATQLALVNYGSIAVHVMAGRIPNPRKSDWVCFDLDPQSGKFADAARAAVYVKEVLDTLKLVSFCKTSGGRGAHIFVPIAAGPDADEVLQFARRVVERVAPLHPKELTTEHSIAARGNRVYLDPFRNGFGQTVVAPYSVRRKPHAPVSTPLDWSELKSNIDPAEFNIGNFAKRIKRADPWKDFFRKKQSLPAAMKAVEKL
jgi:bifunctional non-homologous end joining protein LigD